MGPFSEEQPSEAQPTHGTRESISVVIPVYNEADNVPALVERLGRALAGRQYELLFVDDRSTDGTADRLGAIALTGRYPLRVLPKAGPRGKAYSLLEGFRQARYQYLAMIDGDLQYPPEAIAPMADMLTRDSYDIVVARRLHHEGLARSLVSRTYHLINKLAIRGLDVDVQSGLKVFRREILQRLSINPSPWTFDFAFLLQSRNAGYTIGSYDIPFSPRRHGMSKVRVASASLEILSNMLRTRLRTPSLVPFTRDEQTRHGTGFYYKGTRYVTHNTLHPGHSAVRRLTMAQAAALGILAITVTAALIINWHATFVWLVSLATLVYFGDLLFNLYLIYRSYGTEQAVAIDEQRLQQDRPWPAYTVFCPLYKERAVLPQFTAAMQQLDYPAGKLQVLLLLEEDDQETQSAAAAMDLPPQFQTVVVPAAVPKTKPKACNYGLRRAAGEYAVIYDAEDMPDPSQLKRAVLAFEDAGQEIGCIQAKLNYYNWSQNLLTRLFTLEYSLWFDLVLTGLQAINAPIPLGGTSNHFRVRDLRALGGWDPFNVTEDADLGIRLSRKGYATLMLDSTTYEEANSHLGNWIRQRSRWIKGYLQTYLVHTRRENRVKSMRHLLIFQLVIGGKVLASLINPLFWGLTALYFADRAHVGHFIETLFVPPVYYIGLATFVFGNFLYAYYYMLGAAKRRQFRVILFAVFVPVYWVFISLASYKALYEFITRPFHWQKTRHGLHLAASAGHTAPRLGQKPVVVQG